MAQWYPHYPGDYLRDTRFLTLEEHGAYRLLMDFYYSTGKPIPSDIERIRRILGVSKQKTRKIMKVLVDFFEEKDGLLYHKKIELELDKALKIQERRQASGRAGGKASAIAKAQAKRVATTTTTTIPTSKGPDVGTGKKRFSPPTIEEIMARIVEMKYQMGVEEAEKFFNFYESKGWMVGRNKMKDWKAALANWHKRNQEGDYHGNNQKSGKSSVEYIRELAKQDGPCFD